MPDEKTSRADLLAEKEALELEQLRASVETTRNTKRMRKAAREDNERAFKEKRTKDLQIQAGCNHKKGGRDYAASQKHGDGDNFSVFPWTDPRGRSLRLCSRCLFLWEPGVTAQFLTDGVTKNPTGISWAEAMKLPTDNSPASSVLFGIQPAQFVTAA